MIDYHPHLANFSVSHMLHSAVQYELEKKRKERRGSSPKNENFLVLSRSVVLSRVVKV